MDSNTYNLSILYMDVLLKELSRPLISSDSFLLEPDKISSEIFRILSSREFTYFTKIKAESYRNIICDKIVNLYNNKEQLIFYFNLGGGYHARISGDLSFEPGLSEFFAIFQIKKFIDKILKIYPFGVLFKVIIDNRCAELANNVSIEDTISYSNKLNKMIDRFGLSKNIKLIQESDLTSKDNFEKKVLERGCVKEVSVKECQNAYRFCNDLGFSNSVDCAKKYNIISEISREISSECSKNGIHLRQRATENCFPFRSFLGGDSKIQCGKIALLLEEDIIKKPILVTMNNVENLDLIKIDLPDRFVIKDLLVAIKKN